MYSERDMIEINGRIRRAWAVLIPLLAVIAAAFIAAGVFLLVSLKGERRQNA